MNTKSPLNDAWLFWNAERLDDFPHESENDVTGGEDDADEGGAGRSGFKLMEDLFLYLAGVSAAMVGVGLAVLIGSFISAYAALNIPGGAERAAAVPARPAMERSAPGATVSLPEFLLMEPAAAAAETGTTEAWSRGPVVKSSAI